MSWEKVKLGDVTIALTSGGRPKGGAVDSGIPSLGAEHLSDDGGFNFSKVKYVPENYFKAMKKGVVCKNDILVVKDGATTGKVSIVNGAFPFERASINEHLFQIKIDPVKIAPSYLFYFLYSADGQRQILSDFRGATVGGISRDILDKVIFPLPSLPIQQKIAAILDKVDALRKKDQQLLARYDELLQAVFYDMFGDPVRNEKGWEVKDMRSVSSKITDGEHGTVKRLDQGKLYLMARNVQDNYIDLTDVSFISNTDHSRIYKRCNPEFKDLLLVCVGATTGRVSLVPKMEDFSLARSVALIKPNRDLINPDFLYSIFKEDLVQKQIKMSGNASAQQGLYTGKINEIKIPVPPIKIQNKFASMAQNIQLQKEQVKQQMQQSEALFQSLLQRAFNGELVK